MVLHIYVSSQIFQLERAMNEAQYFDEWSALAQQHDSKSGALAWRQKDATNLYDYRYERRGHVAVGVDARFGF